MLAASGAVGADPVYGSAYPDLGDLLGHRPAWHAQAAGRAHPEASFFPALGESADPATPVCAGRLVRVDCQEAGRIAKAGIFGGRSERERRRFG